MLDISEMLSAAKAVRAAADDAIHVIGGIMHQTTGGQQSSEFMVSELRKALESEIEKCMLARTLEGQIPHEALTIIEQRLDRAQNLAGYLRLCEENPIPSKPSDGASSWKLDPAPGTFAERRYRNGRIYIGRREGEKGGPCYMALYDSDGKGVGWPLTNDAAELLTWRTVGEAIEGAEQWIAGWSEATGRRP